jgi:hypothetical protein
MKNKKAMELSLTLVVVAAILLVVAIVILSIFSDLIGKEKKQADALIGDNDNDVILDLVDKCPCIAGQQEYNGCNKKEDLTDDTKTHRDCLKK